MNFHFLKAVSKKKVAALVTDAYLHLSNGVVLKLNQNNNTVTRLSPAGNFANYGDLECIVVSPDGKYTYIATGGTTFTYFLYKRSGDYLQQLNSLDGMAPNGAAIWSPDGMLSTNAGFTGTPNAADDTFTAYAGIPWRNNQTGGSKHCFSGDSNHIFYGSSGGGDWLRVFKRDRVAKGWSEVLHNLNPSLNNTPYPISLGGNDLLLVFPFGNMMGLTFDPVTGTFTQQTLTGIGAVPASHMELSRDGQYLAITKNQEGSQGGVDMYKRTGPFSFQSLGAIADTSGPVKSAAWSPDGRTLAIGMANANPALRLYSRQGDAFIRVPIPGTIGGWANSGRVNDLAFS